MIEPEDFGFYEKIKVPPPTWCPECRMIRRLSWRNERALFKNKCGFCGKTTVSMYAPETKAIVYCFSCWFSDNWDASDYGVDYDFSRNFFEQWNDLYKAVPRFPLWHNRNALNCDYANFISDSKDVYLSYSVVNAERITYSWATDKSSDCIDCGFVTDSELCYENIESHKNYHSSYLVQSENCINSSFLFDCSNCQDCMLSFNLRNKRYVFGNKQFSKDEYEKILKEYDLGSFETIQNLKKKFSEICRKQSLSKFTNILKSTNVTGDNVENSKNVKKSFYVYDSENVAYMARAIDGTKDSYDAYGIGGAELFYEILSGGLGSQNSQFCFFTGSGCNRNLYSTALYGVSNAFGCVGLRNKQYSVFNKQYSKEEYIDLVERIKNQMAEMPFKGSSGRVYGFGEFFPIELSPFAYNETIAQEYFPLSKNGAVEGGYVWKESEQRNHEVTLKSADLSDNIKDVPDSISNEIIACEHEARCDQQCTQAFRIIETELNFYRRMNLPLPRLCPNCRHFERCLYRNPLKLWERNCMCRGNDLISETWVNQNPHFHGAEKCEVRFLTAYSPNRTETIYCEQCYNAEVV